MRAPLIALALTLLSAPALAQTIEYGKDRLGSDIGNFSLPANSVPKNCQGACQANSSCVAWTFVRSGWQGPTPHCWLKNPAPASTDNLCCVSGTTLPFACAACNDGSCQCGNETRAQLCARHNGVDPRLGCIQQP
jgi:hypothetical protein